MIDVDPTDYPMVLEELLLAEKGAPSDAEVSYLRDKVYAATNPL